MIARTFRLQSLALGAALSLVALGCSRSSLPEQPIVVTITQPTEGQRITVDDDQDSHTDGIQITVMATVAFATAGSTADLTVDGAAAGTTQSMTSTNAQVTFTGVTVPAGAHAGLPVGLSFVGGPFSEGRLLALAYAFEQATHHRTPPRYLPTADVG